MLRIVMRPDLLRRSHAVFRRCHCGAVIGRASNDPFVRQFVNGSSEGPVPFQYPAPGYDADLELASH